MRKLFFIILLILSICGCNNNIYYFNFNARWNWDTLKNNTQNPETITDIENLQKTLELVDARMLLKAISNLESPTQIKKLSDIQLLQDSLGGGFYGLVPDLMSNNDSMPIPNDFESIIKTALYLVDIQTSNINAILKTEYPIHFFNSQLDIKESGLNNSNLELVFDYTCIDETIKLFKKKSISLEDAHQVSGLPGFREMLKHRRNLGYIPEPLPTKESLAEFIYFSASKEPIHMIWKWLNPWNYFNFSDIYLNVDKYSDVLNVLKKNESSIVNYISNKYSPFIPTNFIYTDTLTIAANWGIRSWATNNQFGTNIVQFKDNYNKLLTTLTHEGFHRIQLKLCPVNPNAFSKDIRDFEDIVSYTFPSYQDSLFYETLSYIFLEGTASYLGGMDSADVNIEKISSGIELLQNIYKAIYLDKNYEEVDELNNTGLISNGPFYVLGYHMTKFLLSNYSENAINNLLQNGSIAFFNDVIQLLTELDADKIVELHFSNELENKIQLLSY